ncbi:MAG: hypothetical protein ACRDF0_02110 [Candidatus Limnocylindria bacterium]
MSEERLRRDERGQALVAVALMLGVAGAAIVGLRAAQERILESVRDIRAGEAAVSAAGAVVADRHLAYVRLMHGEGGAIADPDRFLADPAVLDAARAAAAELAALNRRQGPAELTVRSSGNGFEVEIVLAGRRHRAEVPPPW